MLAINLRLSLLSWQARHNYVLLMLSYQNESINIFDNSFNTPESQDDIWETLCWAPFEIRTMLVREMQSAICRAGIGRHPIDARSAPARRPVDVWMHKPAYICFPALD